MTPSSSSRVLRILAFVLVGGVVVAISSAVFILADHFIHGAPTPIDLVLSLGESVVVETESDSLEVKATGQLCRTIVWRGTARSIEIWPRATPWNGHLGGYFPGLKNHWKEHEGTSRCVYEESILRFETEKELNDWLERKKYLEYRFSNDLFVGWKLTLEREQLSVEVYRIEVQRVSDSERNGGSGESDAQK